MAKQTIRNIPSGVGSSDPSLAIDVNRQVPGTNVRPEGNQFQEIQTVLLGAMSDLSAGLRNAGAMQSAVDQHKASVIAKQRDEIRSVQMMQQEGLMADEQARIEKVNASRRSLIMDDRAENPEWVLQNATIQYENADTDQEKEMWFQLLQAAKSQLKQDTELKERKAEREKLEDINLSALTASQVLAEMASELQADPALQAELIGDGKDIHKRVQDWALSNAGLAAPGLFNLDKDATPEQIRARDQMIAQLVKQTLPIGDRLIGQYAKEIQSANESHGISRIDALYHGIQTGTVVEPWIALDTKKDISRNDFSHLTPLQQRDIDLKMAERGIEEASNLVHTQDFRVAKKAVENIIAITGLSDAEANRLRSRADDNFAKNAALVYQRDLSRDQAQYTRFRPWSPGTTGELDRIPDPEAPLKMGIPNESGVSQYMQTAFNSLASMGIDPSSPDLTITQVRIKDRILGLAKEAETSAMKIINEVDKKQQSAELAAAGNSLGKGEDLYDLSITTRMEQLDPEWNNTENRDTRRQAYLRDGYQWSAIRSKHPIPKKAVTDKALAWTSQDPEQMWNVMSFYEGLDDTTRKRFLQQLGQEENGLAIMTSLRETANEMLKSGIGRWEQAWQGANQTLQNWNDLKVDDLNAVALDSSGNRLVVPAGKNQVQNVRQHEVAAYNIVAAMENLVIPKQGDTLIPDQFKMGVGEEMDLKGGPEESPVHQANRLRALVSNLPDEDYDALQLLYQAYIKQGKSPNEAGAAVATYIQSEGYEMVDIGNDTPKFIYNPKRALQDLSLNHEELKKDLNVWMTLPLSGKARLDMVTAFQGINPDLDPKDAKLQTLTDIVRAAYPDGRYGTPGQKEEKPIVVELAYTHPMWKGVQDGTVDGGALVYVINHLGGKDVLLDPRTETPLMVYHRSLTRPADTEAKLKAAGLTYEQSSAVEQAKAHRKLITPGMSAVQGSPDSPQSRVERQPRVQPNPMSWGQ